MTNQPPDPTSDVRRRLVPLLAAVTVLAVLLGGGYALRSASRDAPSGGDGSSPTVLRLDGYQTSSADSATDDQLRLAGSFPEGPDRAAIRWLTAPGSAAVDRLAQALGLQGRRDRDGSATTYTSDAATLRVERGPGGQWQYVRGQFGRDVSCPPNLTADPQDDTAGRLLTCDAQPASPTSDLPTSDQPTSSTVTPDGGTSSSGTALPKLAVTTPEAARAAARPVLEAVGIDPTTATQPRKQVPGLVRADPATDDLPTYGWGTTVNVAGRQVTSANGWLGGQREGATYPVVSAKVAWDQLVHTPRPRLLLACAEPVPPDADPLACGGPITVTGARFGLSVQRVEGRPLLAPSWLFDVQGSPDPLVMVAIDPRYLAAPRASSGGEQPGSPGSTGGGSSGGGPGGGMATSVPAAPPTAEPGTPGDPPADSVSRFSAVAPAGSGPALDVTFTGGVRACFSYTVVPVETEHTVTLSLVEKTSSTRRCIEMAQVYERRVPLTAPVGSRRVVDGDTGAVLLGPDKLQR